MSLTRAHQPQSIIISTLSGLSVFKCITIITIPMMHPTRKYSHGYIGQTANLVPTKRTSLSTNINLWPLSGNDRRYAMVDDDDDCGRDGDDQNGGGMFDLNDLKYYGDVMMTREDDADAEAGDFDFGYSENYEDDDCNDEFVEMVDEKRWFAFAIEDCPSSLKLLVRFYRFFIFSFSGIVFQTSNSMDSQFSTSKVSKRAISDIATANRMSSSYFRRGSAIVKPKTFKANLISLWMLFIHGVMILFYMIPLIFGRMDSLDHHTGKILNSSLHSSADSAELNESIGHSNNKSQFKMEELFGEKHYAREFSPLKPILRNLTLSVTYVFMLDGLVNYVLNLVFGGRLISLIARIPHIHKHDPDKSLAIRLLLVTFGIILCFSTVGLLIFNKSQMRTLYALIFGPRDNIPRHDVIILVKICVITLTHHYHYFLLSMVAIFFVYTMIIFRRQVQEVKDSIEKVSLTEIHLYHIKRHLHHLHAHFSLIIYYYSIPITTLMAANAFLLIGSVCFLMIHQIKPHDYYIVFIFNLGAFAFARLVVVCCAGNAVTTVYREMVRTLYEQIPEWNLSTWMCFLEIKRLEPQFVVRIGGTYTVRQSAILTVLGFALNYIVVLLQTENYSSNQKNYTNSSINSTNVTADWELV